MLRSGRLPCRGPITYGALLAVFGIGAASARPRRRPSRAPPIPGPSHRSCIRRPCHMLVRPTLTSLDLGRALALAVVDQWLDWVWSLNHRLTAADKDLDDRLAALHCGSLPPEPVLSIERATGSVTSCSQSMRSSRPQRYLKMRLPPPEDMEASLKSRAGLRTTGLADLLYGPFCWMW
ncbi:hypothetical protein HFO06_36600 [Rhizobium leguminosarum]|nr:hypothetical protein [Rhizobium leguminosarum]